MSYTDPQSVTIAGTTVSLPRTASGVGTGEFSSSDGSVKMTVSHAYGKRTRRTLRLTQSKIASDPLVPSQNVPSSMSVYIVVDTPRLGFNAAEAKSVVDAFSAYLTASTGARVTQLLGGEN